MRILILGGSGMLGHKLHDVLSHHHDVVSTTRRSSDGFEVDASPFFERGRVLERTDATEAETLSGLLERTDPHVIINCIGVVKQRPDARNPIPSISINALFPHQLEVACAAGGARLIHFSTDCVFSGDRGPYTEEDRSDADDLYGRTKYLGEVSTPALTIRTSIIGRELSHFASLLEWFLGRSGKVKGFTRTYFSGLTTLAMATTVRSILEQHPTLSGLHHVASTRISKFDLLNMVRERFGLDERINLVPDAADFSDRSLRSDRFQTATGIVISSWPDMIDRLAEDSRRYVRSAR